MPDKSRQRPTVVGGPCAQAIARSSQRVPPERGGLGRRIGRFGARRRAVRGVCFARSSELSGCRTDDARWARASGSQTEICWKGPDLNGERKLAYLGDWHTHPRCCSQSQCTRSANIVRDCSTPSGTLPSAHHGDLRAVPHRPIGARRSFTNHGSVPENTSSHQPATSNR